MSSTPPPAGARGPSPGPQPGGPGFQMPMMMGPNGPAMMGPNGQVIRPSPEQIRMIQQKLAEDAQKAGMTVPQFVEQLKKNAMAQQQARMMAAQQQGGAGPGAPGGPAGAGGPQPGGPRPGGAAPGQPVARPIQPGPPNPVAIAMAKFLRSQELKPRTVIMNGQRKDMFRVKRALRALESPAYEKARKKNPALPEIKDRASLENAFKLLPMSMLALRVTKVDPNHGHDHGGKKAKRVKGLWTVKIEPQQDAGDDMYYVWMWEGSQIMRKVYGVLALIVIFTIVLYPLWPLVLRQGVYYLSWGLLMLLGLFFLMAIFRVILFCVTYFVVSPGLWLFPNLWEDVSFLDSFRPVWAWHETAKPKKKKKAKAQSEAASTFSAATGQPAPATATTTATATQIQTQEPVQRAGYVAPRVEELADDE